MNIATVCFSSTRFQWPWSYIAALVAPRPLLFENSGHDPIFPMNGNDRIRARLEKLYGFYTNRTEQLFDIGITPGGHNDNPELRLMAYRWINWHLKGTNAPVTEPELPNFEGKQLRAFPGELPPDELNTKIDEVFVPMATNAMPKTVEEFRGGARKGSPTCGASCFVPCGRSLNRKQHWTLAANHKTAHSPLRQGSRLTGGISLPRAADRTLSAGSPCLARTNRSTPNRSG
jgi:hypothetical protein